MRSWVAWQVGTGWGQGFGMRFGLLGALTVGGDDGGETVVSSPRQRVLLAALLLHANKPVSFDVLAEAVWDGRPPAGAPATLRSHVRHLRATLGMHAAGLLARDPGYMFRVTESDLDTLRFEALCREAGAAHRSAQWSQASAAADVAVGLWRGTPLLDVPSQWLRDQFLPHFERLRLQVLEDRIEADLNLGRYNRLVEQLQELTAQYPLREPFHARLMVALAASGRQAEALQVYRTVRQILVDELGIEPGRDLRNVRDRILRGDGWRVADEPAAASGTAGPPTRPPAPLPVPLDGVPRQLPAAMRYFTGRTQEFRVLSDVIAHPGRPEGAVPIAVVCGYAGIGKTAFAVAFAHRYADRFPGGQVYLNLRGFDPGGAALDTATALRRILDAFAVPAERIPPDLDRQVALYRSHIAGRRMLLVLDNARDGDQVRPLLPGSGGSLVVVTSRDRLAGLVAIEGAVPITLSLFSDDEARELLTRRLGADRTRREAEAVRGLVAGCGGLPLALNIAAARAALDPTVPLTALVGELRGRSMSGAHPRLDLLSTEDRAADIRAVFSWSYQLLDPAAAAMFRLLGLHPGPDIEVEAAARLADVGADTALALLDLLTRVHLLTEHAPGRFALHDLLRAYAAELARAQDGDCVRREATRRVLDHYRYAAHAAAMVLNPGWIPLDLPDPGPHATPAPPADPGQAVEWFTAHHGVLAAGVAWAAESGFATHAWQICWGLAGHLAALGMREELRTAVRIVLSATIRDGDVAGQAFAHRRIAAGLISDGAYADAEAELERALMLYAQLGDRLRTGNTHITIAQMLEKQDRFAEALSHCRQALQLFGDSGYLGGQAQALNSAGWCEAELGHHDQALAYCRQALALSRAIGDRIGEAHTIDSLAHVYGTIGDRAAAIDYYRQALDIHREVGNPVFCAGVLVNLGDAYRAAGDLERTRASWSEALAVFEDLRHPRADDVRARIRALTVSAAPAPAPAPARAPAP